jgi:hypothetical protein
MVLIVQDVEMIIFIDSKMIVSNVLIVSLGTITEEKICSIF